MRSIKSCGLKKSNKAYFAWRLTNWCNYKCSYCPNLRIITDDYRSDEHAIYHNLILARLKTVQMPFVVCLTGGEPTLYPNIREVMKGLSEIENCVDAVLMTNLSRPVTFYEKINEVATSKAVIMASAHPEYVEAERFIDKSVALSKLKPIRYTAHINLVSDPSTWAVSKHLLDTLIGEGVNVKPNMLFATIDSKQNYTQEFYNIFLPYFEANTDGLFHVIDCEFDDGTTAQLNDYQFEIEGLNKFKGYKCKTAAFQITMDGVIQNTCTGRVLPMLLNEKNLVHTETCPKDVCDGRQLLTYHKHRDGL